MSNIKRRPDVFGRRVSEEGAAMRNTPSLQVQSLNLNADDGEVGIRVMEAAGRSVAMDKVGDVGGYAGLCE